MLVFGVLSGPLRLAEYLSSLGRFSGVLHVDGYAGFERLQARGNVVLAACWAHTRRYFYQFFEANGSPVAAEALRRIGELYAIEARIRGQSPALRMAERRTFSKLLVEKLRAWLEQQLSRAAPRGKLADAIRYALTRWDGLTRFLHDGRVDPSRCAWRPGVSVPLMFSEYAGFALRCRRQQSPANRAKLLLMRRWISLRRIR